MTQGFQTMAHKRKKNTNYNNTQTMIKVHLGLSRQTDVLHTHFPRKVSTVEFSIVLAGLHRFVW